MQSHSNRAAEDSVIAENFLSSVACCSEAPGIAKWLLNVAGRISGFTFLLSSARILPVVRNQHLLLCSLLIGNALAMEALPIFLDSLVASFGAILISVTLILLFGEILPQAICTRYGLSVGSVMAPFVRVLVIFFSPVSYPISKLLDYMLGKKEGAIFRRAELKTLVDMHGNEAGKGGELTHDETTIIAGALELTEKTALDAMTEVSEVFSIDITAKLDRNLMKLIMEKGHSRVPVYSGHPSNIIGLILVKNLLAIHAEDNVPVRNLTIRKIPRISSTIPLYDILNEFQKGHSHMAVVVKYSKEKSESMLRMEGSRAERRLSARRHSRRTSDTKGLNNYKFLSLDIPEGGAPATDSNSPSKNPSSVEPSVPDQSAVATTVPAAPESSVPNPGPHPVKEILSGPARPLASQKSRKREALEAIVDKSPESLSNFPNDEEVVGIITMEDLIEELLQEEIWDETDEYIDVHNKIKVNVLPTGGRSPASIQAASLPPTTTSSFPHTPTPMSPRSSTVAPQAPVTTPTRSTGPGSPLVDLAGKAESHHLQLRTLLRDNSTVGSIPPTVDEGRPN